MVHNHSSSAITLPCQLLLRGEDLAPLSHRQTLHTNNVGCFLFPQTEGTISVGHSPLERGGGECSLASAEAKRSAERNPRGERYNEKRFGQGQRS